MLVEARVTPQVIDPARVQAQVADPRAGAVVAFTGLVRNHADGRGVTALSYSAHPEAERFLRECLQPLAERPDVLGLAAVHRVGDLGIGDVAVCVAVAAAHRDAAFDACRQAIDRIKARVPIWKHEVYSGGESEWVGLG